MRGEGHLKGQAGEMGAGQSSRSLQEVAGSTGDGEEGRYGLSDTGPLTASLLLVREGLVGSKIRERRKRKM